MEQITRYTARNRCPICGGWGNLRRGNNERCSGFTLTTSEGVKWLNCSREEYAGGLPLHEQSGTYGHIGNGPCKCGYEHGPALHQPKALPTKTQPEKKHDPINTARPPDQLYNYWDEQGKLLMQVCRWNDSGDKAISQRRPSPTFSGDWASENPKDWLYTTKEARKVLYNLPELLSRPNETVYLVEGEKCADRLMELGMLATTTPMGADHWQMCDLTPLRRRKVVIFPDNDDKGQKYARGIAERLKGTAYFAVIVQLPGLHEKGDIYDWLDDNTYYHSRDDLMDLVMFNLPPKTRFHSSELHLLPRPRWLVPGFIQDSVCNLLSGESGSGKTFLALAWALQISLTYPVLYLAAEDPSQFPPRVWAWEKYFGNPANFFYLETETLQLLDREKTEEIMLHNDDLKPRLVVIDTWAAATPGANENDNGQIEMILNNARYMAKMWDCAVLVVHHMNKAGMAERGGSALRAGVALAMELTAEDDGVKVSFTKVRSYEKQTTRFFRWETVEVEDTDENGKPVMVTSRVALETENSYVDLRGLSAIQMTILKWLGTVIRRDHAYTHKQICDGTGQVARTVTSVLEKLQKMGYADQQNQRGPWRITKAGLDMIGTQEL